MSMRPHDNSTAAAATVFSLLTRLPAINWIAPVNCFEKKIKQAHIECTCALVCVAEWKREHNSCNDLLNTIKIDTDLHYRETLLISIFLLLCGVLKCGAKRSLSMQLRYTAVKIHIDYRDSIQWLNFCAYVVCWPLFQPMHVYVNRWVALFQYAMPEREWERERKR